MAISSVQIANFALNKIGDDGTIESLTEESPQANVCNLWFDYARQLTLAAWDWSFARKRATLAAHADDPPDNWTYRYQYPADCIKAHFIENPASKIDDPLPFTVEYSTNGTKSILTDEEEARLIYTRDATETPLFTLFFIEVLSTVLAGKIAYALTGKQKLGLEMEERARQMLIYAPAMDASEQQESAPREAPQIRGRS